VIFVGDDWAEGHHDVEIVDEQGRRRARRRLPEGVEGVAELHALVADCLGDRAEGDAPDDPAQVVVGIETDRGRGCRQVHCAHARDPELIDHRRGLRREGRDPLDQCFELGLVAEGRRQEGSTPRHSGGSAAQPAAHTSRHLPAHSSRGTSPSASVTAAARFLTTRRP
jgi:hypothetical protein